MKCQGAVARGGAKLVASKLAVFDGCSGLILACTQTTSDPQCIATAGARCKKQIEGVAARAVRLRDTIEKNCRALSRADLLAGDGLAYGEVVGECNADFGLDVCTDPSALASCLVGQHERAAELLLDVDRPRAGELLTLPAIPVDLPFLPIRPGCGRCDVMPRADRTAKAVVQCANAFTKAGRALTTKVLAGLESCLHKLATCAQTKDGDAKCVSKAQKACARFAAKRAVFANSFANAIRKKCDESRVPFGTLAAPERLNLGARSADCAELGIDSGAGLAETIACATRLHDCRIADLVPRIIPTADTTTSGEALSAVASILDGSTCARGPTAVQPERRKRALTSISIKRFLSRIRRRDGASATYVRGSAPGASTNARASVVVRSGNQRFIAGGRSVFRLGYRVGVAAANADHTIGAATSPQRLVVSVQRKDLALEDHFELPLDVSPSDTGEGEVEIVVDYPSDVFGCAFELAFATASDSAVSAYTPVDQVLDVPPVIPVPTVTIPDSTPTATVTATSTSSPTATPTPTASRTPTSTTTPRRSATPTATATPSATRTPTPSPTQTPLCGNEIVEPPEACDPPCDAPVCGLPGTCRDDCTLAKASEIATLQAVTSVGTSCFSTSGRAFDRLVVPQGGTVVPFTIPAGKVFVATALDWALLQAPNARLRVRSARLFAENSGGVNGPAAVSSSTADSAGRAGATQVFPTGIVIKPPGRFCFDLLDPLNGDDFIAVLHGFLVPDE